MTYLLNLVNFGYFLDGDYPTYESALQAAKSVGFEVSIVSRQDGEYTVVGAYSPLNGHRSF